jgi:hypothetical protein
MTVYHVTEPEGATVIERNGFTDITVTFGAENEYTGVWVFDVPLEKAWPFNDRVVFEIDAAAETLSDWEVIDESQPHREWLVPAAVLNRLPRRRAFAVNDDLKNLYGKGIYG